MSVKRVSVTLKDGRKGSGVDISAAIKNALSKRKVKAPLYTAATGWTPQGIAEQKRRARVDDTKEGPRQ